MATPAAWPRLGDGPKLWPTTDALHLWSQVVGKMRLMLTPWVNHSWHATLYLSARGLTTGLVHAGSQAFEVEFDFVASALFVRSVDGRERSFPLEPRSVASFCAAALGAARELGVGVEIHPIPCEIEGASAFAEDTEVRPYDSTMARDYWRALMRSAAVFQRFRTRFLGKCGPVHLFWGSFDLAVTRFSGRRAPRHPGGMPHLPDAVAQEAYSREVSSAGFWPGGPGVSAPAFYSYAYPAPAGFAAAPVAPAGAFFDPKLGEFLLPYAAVAGADDPDAALLAFLQSTYDAAADLAGWDRALLEGPTGPLGRPPGAATA